MNLAHIHCHQLTTREILFQSLPHLSIVSSEENSHCLIGQLFDELPVIVQNAVIHIVDGNHQFRISSFHLFFKFSTTQKLPQLIRVTIRIKDRYSQLKKSLYLGSPSDLVQDSCLTSSTLAHYLYQLWFFECCKNGKNFLATAYVLVIVIVIEVVLGGVVFGCKVLEGSVIDFIDSYLRTPYLVIQSIEKTLNTFKLRLQYSFCTS